MAITDEQRLHREADIAGIDVMLNGVFDSVNLAIPHVRAGGRGGAIVITSSTAGLYGGMADGNPGVMGCIASEHGVVGLIWVWANTLAPTRDSGQRCIWPVSTRHDHDEAFGRFVQEFPTIAANLQNPLLVENGLIEPEDVTNTILHLVSDTGRHITGSTVVDAGFTNK
jgi:NAD(P)-dependent dehydrogenase (short-subunit alcohol dehydrogenase family)